MKNLLFIITIIFSLSCSAQEYPLNTSFKTIPQGSYLKDTQNELSCYTGTWKTLFNGKDITLDIQKIEKYSVKYPKNEFFRDILLIRYTVKDGNGNTLQSTLNHSVLNSNIKSTYVLPNNKIAFTHSGGDCGVGSGRVYLQYIDSTHIKWSYYPESLMHAEGECPQGSDLKVYLSKTEDLVFTKQ
ncbi:hypothetical protein HZQ11_17060 [Elizabethkingia anophelis]|uniref:DUF6705 family protein n=1 Tax=Elizabethkingia TaxID=308865 RepID=UPI0007399B49|nr:MULTISPECIES: DUF6705 family protein [Elizabethkingia]KUF40182.1 hypothetical protein AS358_17260 [Elizabethkingia anophelis]MCT3645865.1 hypothetical protein [Elizabethkingia anophelis]MCT3653189.1 hypothetical protein [Elizabethkingia anophelis]MCT3656991.1 hypothetical protein [Elizabethkingia anophelis]MCT3660452.1 hypothetical protein [Elizabethkingia anophelis]